MPYIFFTFLQNLRTISTKTAVGKFAIFLFAISPLLPLKAQTGTLSGGSELVQTKNIPLRQISTGRVIHRFFDTSPLSPSGRYLALFRMPYENRSPQPGDAGDVLLVDMKTGKERTVAKSRGWEVQLGANVQWGASDSELLFNDVDTTTWKAFCVVLNPATGHSRRLDGTIFMASNNGQKIASYNLLASTYAQVGYGVVIPKRLIPHNIGPVDNDGIDITDIASGKTTRITTIRDIYEKSTPSIAVTNPLDFEYYCFQVKWNPQGTRLLTTLQWSPLKGGARRRSVITMKPDGTDIHTAVTADQWAKGGHHINWMPDGEHLSMNLNIDGVEGLELISMKYDGSDMRTVFTPGSGHPSYNPHGLPLIVTDAYPDEPITKRDGKVPIRLLYTNTGVEKNIAEVFVTFTTGEFRVDPHPAWDRSGRYVIFNGFTRGTRNVFIADLKNIIDAEGSKKGQTTGTSSTIAPLNNSGETSINIANFPAGIDTTKDRVKSDIKIAFPYLGSVKYRKATEIESSNWLIGCETLDRDFTDYDQYKEYLVPLGIRLLRMQAGWAKTEKIKGVYDWAWLDHIVNDATARGLKPWLQTSYGNALYNGGGGTNLGAGMPLSDEALAGYNNWVSAMATRYKNKVKDWEIWNEPNFGDNSLNSPELIAEFNIRTARIIKHIQPEARISGLSLGHIGLDYAQRFFKRINDKKAWNLFDNMTYHDYVYNPDANYLAVHLLREALDKYAPLIRLRQGENGAPSEPGFGRGALGDYNWTELSQAKWDIRRMLGNLGHDIECSVFGIIEMAYTSGPIKRLNYKGIIKSDSTKKAIRPKMAYYAIQNVTSIFDNTLERITGLHHSYNVEGAGPDEARYSPSTDRSIAVYGFRNKTSKKSLYTFWMDDAIPANVNEIKPQTFSFSNSNIDNPVFVDLITGGVYEIPAANWSKKGFTIIFKDIPVYDSPVVIADKSLVQYR